MFNRVGKTRSGDKAEQLSRRFEIASYELLAAHEELNGPWRKRFWHSFGSVLSVAALQPIKIGLLVAGGKGALVGLGCTIAMFGYGIANFAKQTLSRANEERGNLRRDMGIVRRAVKLAKAEGRKPIIDLKPTRVERHPARIIPETKRLG